MVKPAVRQREIRSKPLVHRDVHCENVLNVRGRCDCRDAEDFEIRRVAWPDNAGPKRCVPPLRMTPHHHAFVERKLGHLPRGTNRIERRTRFAFADQVRMRATLLCEGVICRDHDPASQHNPVAPGNACGWRRHKRRHAFLQQARRGVFPRYDRTRARGRIGRREHGRDRRRWCAVVHSGCIKDAPASHTGWQYHVFKRLAPQ